MSLVLNSVSKSYNQAGTQISVLSHLSANIADGELVAIVGPSGSGKSTLLSLLSGLDSPTSGEITINGSQITQMSEAQLTQFRGANIGIVFQQFHLMSHLTALENVLLPTEILGLKVSEAEAKDLLTKVGLSHRLNHFPSQLSGGECQRVAIARSLIVKPKLLLADEPSGNLDVSTGQSVMEVFFGLARSSKSTTLLVTHSEELAKLCDRKLRLQNGQLIEVAKSN